VFPGDRHLNRMDKFTSHVIQMDSNSRSLNFRVSDARALDSEVSNMSLGCLESESLVSEAQGLGRGLGGSRPEAFSGSDMSGL
jgi:hypothetical protein